MKKSIFAVAALGAFASAAQAQSTVTLYGTLDSSVAYLSNIANYSTTNANTTTAGAPLAATSASQSYTTGNSVSFIDSSFATSSWGMRGSEDLGGGMQANFNLESDALTNNGNIHTSASAGSSLFRRAANVSIKDSKLGELFLGRRGNAYVLASGNMLPVSGNTAHQWRSVTNSSIGDQVANSVSWQMPTVMNTAVLVQYGMNNTIDGGDDGTVFSSNFVNKSIQNLTISGSYNNMKAAGNKVAASTALASAQENFKSAANTGTTNQEGYAVGLRYKVNNQWDVGTLYAHGRKNNGGNVGSIVNTGVASTTSSAISTGLVAVGVGYQATPNILLGANYAQTTFQAKMTNLQAHYFLSKRTRIYSQITLTQAAKGNNQYGLAAANSFSPIATNSNTATLSNASLSTTAGAGNIPVNSNAYSLGVIHTF